MKTGTDFAFLHGGGQGGWVWDETIAALEKQTDGGYGRALALDVPGCGSKRGRNTENLAFQDILRELITDLEAAAMEDVVLAGHSQAGTVLPWLAQLRPDLFRRLVYVSCSIPLPGQTVIEMIGDDVHGASDDHVGWPVDPNTTDPRTRTQIMLCNDMNDGETAAFMARLGGDQWPASSYVETHWHFEGPGKVPASYVVCLRDNILPVPWQEKFAGRFHAESEIRIDAGHQVMNTRPHALAEALRLEAAV